MGRYVCDYARLSARQDNLSVEDLSVYLYIRLAARQDNLSLRVIYEINVK